MAIAQHAARFSVRWASASLGRPVKRARLLSSFEPPLKGIRVLDLTRVLAGPVRMLVPDLSSRTQYTTMMLSDLGADVIKIESRLTGDDTRQWLPPSAPLIETPATPPSSPGSESAPPIVDDWSKLPPESAYFLSVNRGKRSVTINLKAQAGVEIVRKLVEQADVFVENYLPGRLAKFGLGYEDCKAINPGLIYASISGYGQTGPYSNRPGYDVVCEMEAGLAHITGTEESGPVKVGVAITDLTTGLYAKAAILAALIGRGKTGRGVHIDANLFDSQIASLANIGSNWLIAGQEATRQGTAHPSIVPYQVFPTQDAFIMIAGGNDGQFTKVVAALGKPEWSSDERFTTNSQRVKNREQLIRMMSDVLTTKPLEHWLAAFDGKGFPYSPVNNIERAIARGVVAEVEHPRAGKIKQLAPAIAYDGEKMKISRPPPVLGQHTVEVLRELGYDDDAIRQLRAESVI